MSTAFRALAQYYFKCKRWDESSVCAQKCCDYNDVSFTTPLFKARYEGNLWAACEVGGNNWAAISEWLVLNLLRMADLSSPLIQKSSYNRAYLYMFILMNIRKTDFSVFAFSAIHYSMMEGWSFTCITIQGHLPVAFHFEFGERIQVAMPLCNQKQVS